MRQEGWARDGFHLWELRKRFGGSSLVGEKAAWSPSLKPLDTLMSRGASTTRCCCPLVAVAGRASAGVEVQILEAWFWRCLALLSI